MTDNPIAITKQLSNHETRFVLPPLPPLHDATQRPEPLQHSPLPSKSLQRAKTMKPKFEKFRGLFKNKELDVQSEKESRSSVSSMESRDRVSMAFSNGDVRDYSAAQPPSRHQDALREGNSLSRRSSSRVSRSATPSVMQIYDHPLDDRERVEQLLESVSQKALSKTADEARQQLQQVMASIQQQQADIRKHCEKKSELQKQVEELNRDIQTQEEEYARIEHKFFEHSRAIRATDDDLSTIRDTFKLLKYSIARIIMTLNKKSNPEVATAKFVKTWPTLQIVDGEGQLESTLINLLTEKLVHEHLVTKVFECPVCPGLAINDAYQSLNTWLCEHGSGFAVRLRQQLASATAKNKNETVAKSVQQAKERIAEEIYNDLADIYHPFLRENDQSVDEEKRYSHKIRDIVEKAMKLAVAIRGQEVDIAILSIKEGEDPFNEETMVDVKGKTSGVVRFCICPAFKGGDGEHGFVEKGKVVVCSTE